MPINNDNSENLIVHIMTCDLFYWEEEVSHCFLSWGDKRQSWQKYAEITVVLHKPHQKRAARLRVYYALHNPQDSKSKDRVIVTAVRNFQAIEPTGFFARK